MNERHPGRPKRKEPWPACKAEGCVRTTEGGSLGFCHAHYVAARRGVFDVETGRRQKEQQRVSSYGPEARCYIPGCARRPKGNGLCPVHWLRQKKGLPLEAPLRRKEPNGVTVTCLLADCAKRATSKGMCAGHAEQRRRGILDDAGNKLREPQRGGRPKKKDKWIGQRGYVLVQAPPDHPNARQDGSILEHRLVVERAISRPLTTWEIVHHDNGARGDNRIENLILLDGRARSGTEAHPPGHKVTAEDLEVLFDHLRLNDPEGYQALLLARVKQLK